MKIKTRVKPRMLMQGLNVQQWYVIEVCLDRSWKMGGDDNGLWKFETEEAAKAKEKEIQEKLLHAVVKQ